MQNKQQQTTKTYWGYDLIERITISENEEVVLGVKTLNGEERFKTWKVRRGFYKSAKTFKTLAQARQDLQARASEWKKCKAIFSFKGVAI